VNIPQNIAPNENYIVVIITQLGLPSRYSVRFDNLMKPTPQKNKMLKLMHPKVILKRILLLQDLPIPNDFQNSIFTTSTFAPFTNVDKVGS
jgi:hypothetical protein